MVVKDTCKFFLKIIFITWQKDENQIEKEQVISFMILLK